MIQFDEHIFRRGWFNHQLVICFSLSEPDSREPGAGTYLHPPGPSTSSGPPAAAGLPGPGGLQHQRTAQSQRGDAAGGKLSQWLIPKNPRLVLSGWWFQIFWYVIFIPRKSTQNEQALNPKDM